MLRTAHKTVGNAPGVGVGAACGNPENRRASVERGGCPP